MANDICGCGECSACEALTARLKAEQTPEQSAYDSHATRLNGSGDEDGNE